VQCRLPGGENIQGWMAHVKDGDHERHGVY
jgi:hypothetical protein